MVHTSQCLVFFSRHDALTDMQQDPLESSRDLELRSNAGLTFQEHLVNVSVHLETNTIMACTRLYSFQS